MPRIVQLPPSVINKIAAGEVIERPASVVKELVENALDSGATRIDVALERGGGDLVRVADNGHGIAPDELELAVAPHATSKLQTADDLFRVASLGFRGEALASIAEVSRATLRSRVGEATGGMELVVNGGLRQEPAPCGCPVGTSVEIRDLFFNTPARRKFLRTTQTELGHTCEAFTRLALAFPQVHFTLRHHDKLLHDLPPADPWLLRIAQFFGRELADQLLWVESQDHGTRLWGYVGHPSISRANQRAQYLFLNGRHIRDRSLQHALGEAYRGLLLTGRYPVAFLSLEMPANEVDVNVHPTKLEVRFHDSGRLYSQLLATLRTRFLTTDLTARITPPDAGRGSASSEVSSGDEGDEDIRRQLVAWAKGQIGQWEQDDAASPLTAEARDVRPEGALQRELGLPAADARPLTLNRLPQPVGSARFRAPDANTAPASAAETAGAMPVETSPAMSAPIDMAAYAFLEHEVHRPTPGANALEPRAPHRAVPSGPAVQMHNRYLVAETREGVVVIDQHALHERILYEQLREKVLGGNFEVQRLLVPRPVDLAPAEAAAATADRALLAQLGIEVEPFGGDTVLVHSHPAMLAHLEPGELLRVALEPLVAGGRGLERRDLLDSLLHRLACKAAVKAGDPLSEEEIAALLDQRGRVQDAHHCPHGRPTELVFTREELDKQFKRI